jgi:hypothetical protein
MAEVYILDNVIRKISKSDISSIDSTQKIVIIDPQNKKVLSRKPLFGSYVEFFLVSNSNNPRHVASANLRFDIGDTFANKLPIRVFVSYQVTCPPGKEDIVALALSEGNTPGVTLNDKITAWLTEYSRTRFTFDDFANNYKKQFLILQRYAEAKVNQEIGLNINLKLDLQQEDLNRLHPYYIKSNYFPIFVSDYEQAIDFRFETNLLISDNGEVNALRNFNDLYHLEDILKTEIDTFLRRHVCLYDFIYNFNQLVYRNLIEYLDTVLAKYGRKIDYLTPDIEPGIFMPDLPPVQHNIKCEMKDSPQPIVINSILNVEPQPENILKYKNSQISDLTNWFKVKLEQVVQKKLFDCEYISLLTDFDSIQLNIEETLKQEVETIGYSIKLISTLPNDFKPNVERLISIVGNDFPVLVKDYEREINFSFSTNLLLSANGELNALRHIREVSNFESLLRYETRIFLRQEVLLYDLCYRFSEVIRPQLIEHLNKVLAKYGREVEYFIPEIDKNILMPESFSMKHDVRCEIRGYSKVFVVSNTLNIQPQLKDIVKYKQAQILDLKTWLRENLEHLIQEYLFDYEYTKLWIEFSNFISTIQEKLKNKADAIGYSVKLALTLPNDFKPEIKSVPIASSYFPVLVADYEREINFRFSTNLLLTSDGEQKALESLREVPKLENILKDEVRRFLRQNISLYALCYRFSESVRSYLVEHLNTVLAKYGREIEYFTPDIDKNILMPEFLLIKHDVRCEITEYPEPININNTLEVEPLLENAEGKPLEDSIVKYKKAQISNLQMWFREKVNKVVKQELFNKKYIDILLNFEPIQENVKKGLEEEAGKIGYSIRLITTVPDLKPLKLKSEGFKFERNETFATKQGRVKVGLKIVVLGRIEDLKKIYDHLNKRIDVEELITRKVIDSISEILHDVEPDDFYFYFDDGNDSVKSKLKQKIEDVLENEFYASSIKVNLKIDETTELPQRYQALIEKSCEFRIKIASFKDYGESADYNGSFRVDKIEKDKWHIFQSKSFEIVDIRDYLEKQLQYCFRTFNSEMILYTTKKQLSEILQEANDIAKRIIPDEFGVSITITRFGREDTESEKNIRTLATFKEN